MLQKLYSSSLTLFQNIYRLAQRRSRVTLGVVAGAIVAVIVSMTALTGSSGGTVANLGALDNPAAHSSGVAAAETVLPTKASQGAAGSTKQVDSPQAPSTGSGTADQPSSTSSPQPMSAKAGLASKAAPAKPKASQAPAKPYQFYDTVSPQSVPANQIVATYSTGKYAVSAAQAAGHKGVMWIDVGGMDTKAQALDVEPGNVGPAGAAMWAKNKLSADPNAIARIYTFQAEWPAVKAAVSSLPSDMQSRIHWWIADPTGSEHQVPGAMATQWYWGPSYDISTAQPGF